MKKKVLIGLLLLIPFISILLIVLFRTVAEPTNEEIIQQLKDIKAYTSDVEYIFINTKDELREETKQFYEKDKGVRVEFGKDRTKIYKENTILIKDNIGSKEYTVEAAMDKVHSIAFMKNILSYPIEPGSIKCGQEEWGDRQYLEATINLYLDNEHMEKAKIFIDKEKTSPIGVIVYDKDGKDRIRIIYKNFEKVKQIDENLL